MPATYSSRLAQILVVAVIYLMNATKSREVIWGGRVSAATISAEEARKRAVEAVREADRAEAHAWSLRMEASVARLWGKALRWHR